MREEFHSMLAKLIAEWADDRLMPPERMINDLKVAIERIEAEQLEGVAP